MAKGKFNLNQLLSGTSLNNIEQEAAESPPPRPQPLKVVSLSVNDLVPSSDNFYSVQNIAELKMSIEMFGVKQNLTVKPLEDGKYKIIAGHRRHLACKALVAEGKPEFEYVPCGIESERDEIKERILLIMTNSTARELSDWEKTRQAEELQKYFEILKKRDGVPGRVRDLVAEALNTSPTQVGRMDAINNNLSPELQTEFKEGRLGFSVAYELSGLSPEKQKEAFDEHRAKGGLSINDAKGIKDEVKQPPAPPVEEGPEAGQEKGSGDDLDRDYDAEAWQDFKATGKNSAPPPTPSPIHTAPENHPAPDESPAKPEKRDFADMTAEEKADSAIALLNYYRFTIFQPGEDTRFFDFIIDALEYYKDEKGEEK